MSPEGSDSTLTKAFRSAVRHLEQRNTALLTAAVALFGVVGIVQQHRLQVLEVQFLQGLSESFEYRLRDRLIGESLLIEPLQDLTGTFVDASELLRNAGVLWIFDPNECEPCSREVQGMNRGIVPHFPQVVVVMSGVSPKDAAEVARDWGFRIEVLVDEHQRLRDRLALPFASTYLVLNRSGRIVYTGIQTGDQACGQDIMELARRLVTPTGTDAPPLSGLSLN